MYRDDRVPASQFENEAALSRDRANEAFRAGDLARALAEAQLATAEATIAVSLRLRDAND